MMAKMMMMAVCRSSCCLLLLLMMMSTTTMMTTMLTTMTTVVHAAPLNDLIIELPGYGRPPTPQFSGYLDASAGCNIDLNGPICKIHYWLALAATAANDEEDPLLSSSASTTKPTGKYYMTAPAAEPDESYTRLRHRVITCASGHASILLKFYPMG